MPQAAKLVCANVCALLVPALQLLGSAEEATSTISSTLIHVHASNCRMLAASFKHAFPQHRTTSCIAARQHQRQRR